MPSVRSMTHMYESSYDSEHAPDRTYNADPPLSDLTMLACVLQAAKIPSRNGGPFYGPNRGGPTFSNSRSKIKLRRNRVKNTPQGFTLLLQEAEVAVACLGSEDETAFAVVELGEGSERDLDAFQNVCHEQIDVVKIFGSQHPLQHAARASTLEGQSLCLVCESVIRLANKTSVSTEIKCLRILHAIALVPVCESSVDRGQRGFSALAHAMRDGGVGPRNGILVLVQLVHQTARFSPCHHAVENLRDVCAIDLFFAQSVHLLRPCHRELRDVVDAHLEHVAENPLEHNQVHDLGHGGLVVEQLFDAAGEFQRVPAQNSSLVEVGDQSHTVNLHFVLDDAEKIFDEQHIQAGQGYFMQFGDKQLGDGTMLQIVHRFATQVVQIVAEVCREAAGGEQLGCRSIGSDGSKHFAGPGQLAQLWR
jgi:hypothetical protein